MKSYARDTEKAFTERATEATDKWLKRQNKVVSPLVYVPRELRQSNVRLTVNDLYITVEPEDVAENHLRIAKADPLGFLIACMNGQPIPTFVPQDDGTITVEYEITPQAERIRIAQALASKITFKIPQIMDPKKNASNEGRSEYQAMIDNAIQKAPKEN